MADERTTQPMLEALLEGQRQFAAQLTELLAVTASILVKQDEFAAKLDQFGARQDEFAARQDELAARQDQLAARQERLELAVIELTREVRVRLRRYQSQDRCVEQPPTHF